MRHDLVIAEGGDPIDFRLPRVVAPEPEFQADVAKLPGSTQSNLEDTNGGHS